MHNVNCRSESRAVMEAVEHPGEQLTRVDGSARPRRDVSLTQHPRLARLLHGTEHQYPTELAVQFGRIFERIMSLWGSPALDEYFRDLLLDGRGDRQGFPSGVVRDLFMLQQLHEDCKLRQHPDDIWADEKWVHCFEERGLDFSPNGFFRALESGDEGAVRLFIEAGVDLELTNAVGWTPLMVAVFMGSEKNAALLIKAGARINCRDRRGYGPLHWAALKGYETVVHLLLRKGAFVNLKSDKGITPLLQASSCGH